MTLTPFSPQSFRTSDPPTEAAPLLGTLVCVVPEFVSLCSSLWWPRRCSAISVERKTSKKRRTERQISEKSSSRSNFTQHTQPLRRHYRLPGKQ